MNEQIKLLAEQATTTEYGVDNGFDRVTFDKEKFAELIVRDCCDFIEAGHHSMVDRLSLSTHIKRRFGIVQ